MRERRLRTAVRKKLARARFWNVYGERIRLALIGASMVLAASWIARMALG